MDDTTHDWIPTDDRGFIAHVGPLLKLDQTGEVVFGLRAQEHHHNVRGVMQGGMIATLLDKVIGTNIRAAYPEGGYATVELNVRYFSPVKIGEFVVCRGKVDHRTEKLTYASGELTVGDRTAASATGVWRNLGT